MRIGEPLVDINQLNQLLMTHTHRDMISQRLNKLTISQLNFVPLESSGDSGDIIATINASTEGLTIVGERITINADVTFAAGYDPSTKIEEGGAAADVNNNVTTISGGKITTGSIQADKMDVTQLSAIAANLGTITAGSISGVTISIGSGETKFNTDVNGNSWWGASLIGSAVAKILNTGAASFSSIAITGGTLDIGGADATSAHIDATGNQWWGAATYAAAPAKVSNAGAIWGSSVTITGGSVAGSIISSGISASNITTGTLSASRIAAGSLDASKITAGTITATQIHASTITTSQLNFTPIQAGGAAADVNAYATTISGTKITTGTITAAKLSVSSLSSISANIGTITAGTLSAVTISAATITGSVLQTGTSGENVNITASQIQLRYGSTVLGTIRGYYGGASAVLVDVVKADTVVRSPLINVNGSAGNGYAIFRKQSANPSYDLDVTEWPSVLIYVDGNNNICFLNSNGEKAYIDLNTGGGAVHAYA